MPAQPGQQHRVAVLKRKSKSSGKGLASRNVVRVSETVAKRLAKARGAHHEYLARQLANPPSSVPDSIAAEYNVVGFTEMIDFIVTSAHGRYTNTDKDYVFSRTFMRGNQVVLDYVCAWHLERAE